MANFHIDTNSSVVRLKVNYFIEQDKLNNRSTVKVDLYFLTTGNSNGWNMTGGAYYNIGINNKRKGDTNFTFDLRGKAPWTQTYIGSHSYTVTHDSNGEAEIPIWVYVRTGVHIGTINQTRRITLPKIVTKPEVSVADTNLSDSGVDVTISNMSPDYRYQTVVYLNNRPHWSRLEEGSGNQTFSYAFTENIRNQILIQTPDTNKTSIRVQVTTLDKSNNPMGSSINASSILTVDSKYAPTAGTHTLTQFNQRNGNLYENVSYLRINIGDKSGSTTPTFPQAYGSAKIVGGRIFDRNTNQTLYTLKPSDVAGFSGNTPVHVELHLKKGNYVIGIEFTDSRGNTSSPVYWSNTYTFHAYTLPQIARFNSERDGNTINVSVGVTPGTDSLQYQTFIDGKYKVHDKKALTTTDKYGQYSIDEVITGYYVNGAFTKLEEQKSYEIEVRIYYTDTDYVSARGTVGTADVPLSLGKFGAGVGKVVDDNGAHLQVGDKGISSDGPLFIQGDSFGEIVKSLHTTYATFGKTVVQWKANSTHTLPYKPGDFFIYAYTLDKNYKDKDSYVAMVSVTEQAEPINVKVVKHNSYTVLIEIRKSNGTELKQGETYTFDLFTIGEVM